MIDIDRLIIGFDRTLRTLFAPATSARPTPGEDLPESEMDAATRQHATALMRVNHTGEICAQALYQGQALTARNAEARTALEHAAQEETEHLAWTEQRIQELGGRKSVLNPLFYAGSMAMGVATGLLGDRWNLGFLAETERQVVEHLDRDHRVGARRRGTAAAGARADANRVGVYDPVGVLDLVSVSGAPRRGCRRERNLRTPVRTHVQSCEAYGDGKERASAVRLSPLPVLQSHA
jgi:ubiquinone biosynthesis monooxygenase Coq7